MIKSQKSKVKNQKYKCNKKILIIGSAVVDLIFQGEIFEQRRAGNRLSLAYGGKYVVDKLYQCFGGGGANTAVSLVRQGLQVYLWTKIGKDSFGQMIVNNLQKEGVKLDLVEKTLPRSALSAILLDLQGRRTIVNYRAGGDQLDFGPKIREILLKCRWLALFSMPRWPKLEKLKALKFAKQMGLKVFLSLHGDEYRKGLDWVKDYFALCDVLDLNVYELAAMLAKKVKELNLAKVNYSQKLGIPWVIVTHDKKGSHFYSSTKVLHQEALPARCLDTTGAGDAFSAGFLGKYIKTGDFAQAMKFAAQNAKAEIEAIGAQTGLLYDR